MTKSCPYSPLNGLKPNPLLQFLLFFGTTLDSGVKKLLWTKKKTLPFISWNSFFSFLTIKLQLTFLSSVFKVLTKPDFAKVVDLCRVNLKVKRENQQSPSLASNNMGILWYNLINSFPWYVGCPTLIIKSQMTKVKTS